jgi:hypothetical protein
MHRHFFRRRWAGVLSLGLAALAGYGAGQANWSAPVWADPAPVTAPTDNSQRVVAYIHGSTPITREEYGEYLITRSDYNRLELLINKRIIEAEAAAKNVVVTPEEIEASINEDVKSINVGKTEFVNQVLKRYGKTLFEWKEDVVKPKLMLQKLYRGQVEVTADDLQQAFACRYGEKVDCRVILVPTGEDTVQRVTRLFEEVRANEQAFLAAARKQAVPALAMAEGQINPIARYMGGDSNVLEEEAFKLQAGDVSRPVQTKQGTFIIRCTKRIPPEAGKTIDGEKAVLSKEVIDRKMAKGIEQLFKELRDKANPTFIMPRPKTTEEVKHDAEKLLKETAPVPMPGGGQE